MEPKDLLVTLYARLKVMDEKLSALEGRVAVLDDITIDHESRLQELEEADDEWRDS